MQDHTTKMNINKMLSNRNIIKYFAKYFAIGIGSILILGISAKLNNEKDTVSNLIGSTLFAGLFLGWLLILKSDVTKFITTLGSEQNKTEEKK